MGWLGLWSKTSRRSIVVTRPNIKREQQQKTYNRARPILFTIQQQQVQLRVCRAAFYLAATKSQSEICSGFFFFAQVKVFFSLLRNVTKFPSGINKVYLNLTLGFLRQRPLWSLLSLVQFPARPALFLVSVLANKILSSFPKITNSWCCVWHAAIEHEALWVTQCRKQQESWVAETETSVTLLNVSVTVTWIWSSYFKVK